MYEIVPLSVISFLHIWCYADYMQTVSPCKGFMAADNKKEILLNKRKMFFDMYEDGRWDGGDKYAININECG